MKNIRDVPGEQPPGIGPISTVVVDDAADRGTLARIDVVSPGRRVVNTVRWVAHQESWRLPGQHAGDVRGCGGITTEQAVTSKRNQVSATKGRWPRSEDSVLVSLARGRGRDQRRELLIRPKSRQVHPCLVEVPEHRLIPLESELVDVGAEALAIDRAVEAPRCGQPRDPQRGEKRAGRPAPAGGVVVAARAARCPVVPPKQIGGDAGFVQKHEGGDIPGRRPRVPRDPRGRDVRPIVFGRADRVF